MFRITFLFCSAVVLSACASGTSALKKTAAADLGCPSKQLEVEQLDKSRAGATWLVTGCGKTAQYSVAKKSVTRTTEITAYTPPPPPAAPPPPPAAAAPSPQFQSFMDQHNQQMAGVQARQQAFLNAPAPGTAAPPPAPAVAAPAPESAAPVANSSQAGWVCINNQYFSCPTEASTVALGAYGQCRIRCAMGAPKCSSCVVGEGEKCTPEPSRNAECKQ